MVWPLSRKTELSPVSRPNHHSDVTNEPWDVVRKPPPRPSKRGRKPLVRREVINARLHVNRTGCQGRTLAHDFPKWKSVYIVCWR